MGEGEIRLGVNDMRIQHSGLLYVVTLPFTKIYSTGAPAGLGRQNGPQVLIVAFEVNGNCM